MKIRALTFTLYLGILLAYSAASQANGIVIDKIYHPYVRPLEQELEWRAVLQDHQPGVADNTQLYKFAYGRALSERWSAEAYLVGEKSRDQSFRVEGYEVEVQWQLTEQGEYWADWGMLFEVEKQANKDLWEFSTAVLVEKEWGKWSGTANLYVLGEWGSAIANEMETRMGLQARYRYSRAIEPAIEFYRGQGTQGLGPALLGQIRLPNRKKLNWEVGLIMGLENSSPNRTLRMLLDFEF